MSKEQMKEASEADNIYQIFDKVFKKVITLSSKAVINLINGLFETDYPLDSKITYNWTEFEDDKLRKILADTILTINESHSYHLEAQMEKDNSIVFRVFDYGFQHANRTRTVYTQQGKYTLRFPEPIVIYLYYEGNVPDQYTLSLEKDNGDVIGEYTVPVVKIPDLSVEEMNDRKLIVLIPFHLLKLRKLIKNSQHGDLEFELKKVVYDDIIGSINRNLTLGNIAPQDAYKLKQYVTFLGRYLSKHYKGLEALQDMTDESFMTEADILCEQHEKELMEKDEIIAEKDKSLAEKEKSLAEKDKSLADKDDIIAQLQQEIAHLKSVN